MLWKFERSTPMMVRCGKPLETTTTILLATALLLLLMISLQSENKQQMQFENLLF